jgi:outer membrane lipoprotein SlyB
MRGISARAILLPVLLAGGVGACANNAVQPGYVNTASGYSTASASTYGQPVGSGRVVAINDVSLQGGGGSTGSGPSNGTMMGGLLGGLGGIAIGASGGRGLGGGLIGGVLGAVGGAIAGTIIDRHTSIGGGRGIEVTVQKDDGQQVTIAQRDDGDVQLGDRVQILQDRNGVAKAVRDNSRQQDYQNRNGGYQNAGPAPQDYRQANNYGGSYGGGSYGGGSYGGGSYGPPPQDYRQSQQNYGPQPADYGQPQRYAPPQSSSHSGYSSYSGGSYQGSGYANGYQTGPQPQNDPRYGTLQ